MLLKWLRIGYKLPQVETSASRDTAFTDRVSASSLVAAPDVRSYMERMNLSTKSGSLLW